MEQIVLPHEVWFGTKDAPNSECKQQAFYSTECTPPKNYCYEKLLERLDTILDEVGKSKYKDDLLICVGDFNAHVQPWVNTEVISTKERILLNNFLESMNLSQLDFGVTRDASKTCLHLVITFNSLTHSEQILDYFDINTLKEQQDKDPVIQVKVEEVIVGGKTNLALIYLPQSMTPSALKSYHDHPTAAQRTLCSIMPTVQTTQLQPAQEA
ncbi:unnamed protein product [Didymodactylos carnosus]|uniref:Endonuclease/exonuclease/phosphatase domain-containing protein n=1 Tax=Didymodactylos carnosus TaxID=1234261 RepID=A0A814YZM9_9BILA|nr:unnamed protein product [Didymodactylos carnosus]CAF3997555.1 unnamed protein product [Didymodactylos carnosus]